MNEKDNKVGQAPTNAEQTAEKKNEVKGAPQAPVNEVKAVIPAPEVKTEVKEVIPTPQPAPKVETQAEQVLNMSKEIERLKAQLRQEPQTIEERLEYYKHKQELTAKYEQYAEQVESLDKLMESIANDNNKPLDFDNNSDYYRLKLIAPGYGDRGMLTISNADLLNDVLSLLQDKMKNKMGELQKEIAA